MTEIARLLPLLTQPGQPEAMFKALDEAAQRLVGHQLFTLLFRDGGDVARCYSSRPSEYPVAGRKAMGSTPWGDLVLQRQQPYLGPDKAGIRWAFFDYELIESMGLGAVINIPVIYDGAVIGTMNVLDAEHAYEEDQIPLLLDLAPLLIPAFLQARR
jgi:GAF domain-containing protein